MRTIGVTVVATAFAFLVASWLAMPFTAGDTAYVLDGSNAFLTCLSNHDYSGCGYTGQLNDAGLMTPVGDWPLLQHVPDVIAIELGADRHDSRSRALEILGVLGVVAGVLAAWAALARTRQRGLFWAFMLALLSGPLLWYARTTFGEALSAGLLVMFVAATVVPAPSFVVAVATVAAAWTKETTYPFLIALGVVGLLAAQRRTGVRVRPHLVWGAIGLAVAIAAASLFNVVRYGKVISPNFSESQLHSTGLLRKLEYAAAVVVSPSGGMVFFWVVAGALVGGAVVFALRGRDRFEVAAASVVLLVVLGLALGFASWWTPFGWAAYGNRLVVPWGLPLTLLVLVVFGDTLRAQLGRLLTRAWRFGLVLAVVLALTLPAVGTMWRPGATGRFFTQEQPCERPWLGGVEAWHTCQHRLFWVDRPMPLYALRGVATPGGAATMLLVGAAVLACLVLLRGEFVPAQQRPMSSGATEQRGSAAAST